jgi:hypothetical protein
MFVELNIGKAVRAEISHNGHNIRIWVCCARNNADPAVDWDGLRLAEKRQQRTLEQVLAHAQKMGLPVLATPSTVNLTGDDTIFDSFVDLLAEPVPVQSENSI